MNLLDKYLLLVLGREQYGFGIGWKTSFPRLIVVGFLHLVVGILIISGITALAPMLVVDLADIFAVGILALALSTFVGFFVNIFAESLAKKRGLQK